MSDQKDGHRYTLSVAHQDLPAILMALRIAAGSHHGKGYQTTDAMLAVRADLIKQRDAQPWVAAGQPGRDAS